MTKTKVAPFYLGHSVFPLHLTSVSTLLCEMYNLVTKRHGSAIVMPRLYQISVQNEWY